MYTNARLPAKATLCCIKNAVANNRAIIGLFYTDSLTYVIWQVAMMKQAPSFLQKAACERPYLITLTRSGAIVLVYAGSPATAVEGAVKLVDGDGIGAVIMVITLYSSIPGSCMHCKNVTAYITSACSTSADIREFCQLLSDRSSFSPQHNTPKMTMISKHV